MSTDYRSTRKRRSLARHTRPGRRGRGARGLRGASIALSRWRSATPLSAPSPPAPPDPRRRRLAALVREGLGGVTVAVALVTVLLAADPATDPALLATFVRTAFALLLASLIALATTELHTLAYLSAVGPIAPAAATVCTIGLYLLPVPNREPGHVPVAVGFLAGSVAALGAAWAARSIATGPDSNGIAFSELQARTDTIRCRISAVLHAEARLQVASVDRDRCISIIRGDLAWLDAALNPTATDFAWLVGLKFIQAKRVVHDAEEQLLLLASMTELRGVIREETVRIADANTDKRAEWTSWLNQANDLLRAPERESQAEGRELLRRVRRARNHLREEADYQTVQLRNRVVLTITVAGVGLWFLLAMAIIRGASPTTIHGAASLFLVAGVVGLLRGLIQERRRPAEADYGLAVSRVWRTVFISGTAGVFAVPIVALITGQSAIGIELLFDIGAHPSGLLIAAAAGLVPARIVDLIAEFADSFSNWIHSRSDPPKPPKDDDLS